MRQFLVALVIGATFLVPTQIMFSSPAVVLAADDEEADTYNFQIMGRVRALEMQMETLEHKLMENRGKMSKAKMEKMEKMLSRLEKEIQELIKYGDE